MITYDVREGYYEHLSYTNNPQAAATLTLAEVLTEALNWEEFATAVACGIRWAAQDGPILGGDPITGGQFTDPTSSSGFKVTKIEPPEQAAEPEKPKAKGKKGG